VTTPYCTVSWQEQLGEYFTSETILPLSKGWIQVTFSSHAATGYRDLYLAYKDCHQNTGSKSFDAALGRAQGSPDVARLGKREIEPINVRLKHDGKTSGRFASHPLVKTTCQKLLFTLTAHSYCMQVPLCKNFFFSRPSTLTERKQTLHTV
jgi:hypothetical protein